MYRREADVVFLRKSNAGATFLRQLSVHSAAMWWNGVHTRALFSGARAAEKTLPQHSRRTAAGMAQRGASLVLEQDLH
jgi:hypothetical protein